MRDKPQSTAPAFDDPQFDRRGDQRSNRRHRRVRIEAGTARLIVDDFEQEAASYVVNISVSGTAVTAPQPLGQIDDKFTIELRGAKREPWTALPCRIHYILGEAMAPARDPRWLHGASFDQLSQDARQVVEKFVRARIEAEQD